MFRYVARKLAHGYIWERIFVERLAEPIHLNLASIPVALLGTFRSRLHSTSSCGIKTRSPC